MKNREITSKKDLKAISSGATAIEYGLIAAGIAVAIIAATKIVPVKLP